MTEATPAQKLARDLNWKKRQLAGLYYSNKTLYRQLIDISKQCKKPVDFHSLRSAIQCLERALSVYDIQSKTLRKAQKLQMENNKCDQ